MTESPNSDFDDLNQKNVFENLKAQKRKYKDFAAAVEVQGNLEKNLEYYEILHKKEKIEDRIVDRKLRRDYAKIVVWYLIGYSTFVGILIVLNGFCWTCWSIDNSVIITMAGANLVSVLGLVGLVIKGVFRSSTE